MLPVTEEVTIDSLLQAGVPLHTAEDTPESYYLDVRKDAIAFVREVLRARIYYFSPSQRARFGLTSLEQTDALVDAFFPRPFVPLLAGTGVGEATGALTVVPRAG